MTSRTALRKTDAAPGEAPQPRGCTHLRLRQLDRALTRHYDAFVEACGLGNLQYSLLSHVVLLGPIGLGELARRVRLDASTLTRNLQLLQRQGWVATLPGDDARSRKVQATEAGAAKRAEARQAWKRAQQALNDRLGVARVSALHALLDDCLQVLDAAEPLLSTDQESDHG